MKFIQKYKIQIHEKQEHILIPYFEETDMKKQLQQLPLESHTSAGLAKDYKKFGRQTIIIPFQSRSMAITFMPLGLERNLT